MRQENRQINIYGFIIIADFADFLRRLVDIHKGSHEVVILRRRHDLLGDDADKENIHACRAQYLMRVKDTHACGLDVQIRVHDREFTAFFEEQEMCHPVVNLVIAKGDNIRRQIIHDFDGADALIFRVNDGAAEHISRDHIQRLRIFRAHLVQITAEHGYAAHQIVIDFLCQKIPMHVIGM